MTTQTHTTDELTKGQRVYVRTFDGLEPAKVVRQCKPLILSDGSEDRGWYVIRYDDGGSVSCHATRMTLGNG